MSEQPGSILEAQLQSLLELVEQRRNAHCDAITRQAEEEAAQLLRDARREARTRLQKALAEERREARRQLESAEAQRRSRQREREHRRVLKQLRQGWEQLREELIGRWKEASTRQSWIEALAADAAGVLPPGLWCAEHPAGLDDASRKAIAERLGQIPGVTAELLENTDLAAGLRIRADGACLDASVGLPASGLLADREAVEAQLLAELQRLLRHRSGEHQP